MLVIGKERIWGESALFPFPDKESEPVSAPLLYGFLHGIIRNHTDG